MKDSPGASNFVLGMIFAGPPVQQPSNHPPGLLAFWPGCVAVFRKLSSPALLHAPLTPCVVMFTAVVGLTGGSILVPMHYVPPSQQAAVTPHLVYVYAASTSARLSFAIAAGVVVAQGLIM